MNYIAKKTSIHDSKKLFIMMVFYILSISLINFSHDIYIYYISSHIEPNIIYLYYILSGIITLYIVSVWVYLLVLYSRNAATLFYKIVFICLAFIQPISAFLIFTSYFNIIIFMSNSFSTFNYLQVILHINSIATLSLWIVLLLILILYRKTPMVTRICSSVLLLSYLYELLSMFGIFRKIDFSITDFSILAGLGIIVTKYSFSALLQVAFFSSLTFSNCLKFGVKDDNL